MGKGSNVQKKLAAQLKNIEEHGQDGRRAKAGRGQGQVSSSLPALGEWMHYIKNQ
jgi:hypothetical protein